MAQRKVTQAQKQAMEEGRNRARAIRKQITEVVENCPDALTKPSVWKDVSDETGKAIVAAITKARTDRLEARQAELKAELEKVNAELGTEG